MSLSKTIADILSSMEISYEIKDIDEAPYGTIAERAGIPESSLLRAVLLQAEGSRYLAVLPADHLLDFEVAKRVKGLDFSVASTELLQHTFRYLDTNAIPALPEGFGVTGLIDESVFSLSQAYIMSGDNKQLIKLENSEIRKLYNDCERLSFACGPSKLYSRKNAQQDVSEAVSQFTPLRIKQRIDETFDLPAMPDIAQDIMRLRVDPSADAKKLGEIVEKDPSLAAQIISWASSPYYGYKGAIDSVETAISRVLGFDLVMNLALGISIGKSLNVPDEGPLGLSAFWRQAVYSASLVEKLCLMIPPKQRPERGLAYLSGLLHNFGHLLLGHLFLPQFKLINQYISANPAIRIEDIEHFVMGVTHQEIGAWLMKNWHMPEELIIAVRWHHQEEFWSQHAVYSNLVLLSNRLLKRIEMGDETVAGLPKSTLDLLGLDEDKINASFEQLLEERKSLDIMSKQLVA
ncbi:MAG: HDOD domain-containing protein [Gammaproteobacteria bacterium]|nr:HDOD domain-containing protein [Gammaproteobacteria bacterium]